MCDFTGQISIDGDKCYFTGEFFVKLFSQNNREIEYNNIMIRNNNLKNKIVYYFW